MRAISRYLLIALALFISLSVMAQTTTSAATPAAKTQASKPDIKTVPAIYTDPTSGRQMFDAYCAACHGQSGTGNGPAAPALKVPPTNLTLLSKQHGGKFPETHVVLAIKGDSQTSAHGNQQMPVWGNIFRSMGETSDGNVQLRIRNLTTYIEGMQQK